MPYGIKRETEVDTLLTQKKMPIHSSALVLS